MSVGWTEEFAVTTSVRVWVWVGMRAGLDGFVLLISNDQLGMNKRTGGSTVISIAVLFVEELARRSLKVRCEPAGDFP